MTNLLSFVLMLATLCGSGWLKAAKIKAADVQRLTGAQWKGTLTYLDYSRNKKVSIPSNLIVTPASADGRTWIFEFQYPDEPQANSQKTIALDKGGTALNDETVVERIMLANQTLKIVTQKSGLDNERKALFRFTYLIGERSFSLKKEVRYEGTAEFFERNEYSWRR